MGKLNKQFLQHIRGRRRPVTHNLNHNASIHIGTCFFHIQTRYQ
uniref:Uncharacterized protein n=1 Tax=Rhizophora mucronata TaxID=61149 RepID=A0A2P2PSP2_RHIMU